MAAVQVQKKSAGGLNGVTVVLDATPTVGNVLIAVHFTRATNASATGFTQDALINNATESDQLAIWHRVVQSGDGTSWTFGDNNDNHAVTLFEYSGLNTASLVDKTATTGRTTSASSLSSGTTATTTQANELAIVGIGLRIPAAGGDGSSPSWSNSFNLEGNVDSGQPTNLAQEISGSKILSATGAIESTCSWTNALTVMGIMVTYKALIPIPNRLFQVKQAVNRSNTY